MEYIELIKDYIYEITWHVESELYPNKNPTKDTRYFCYTGSCLADKTEEELTQSHIFWHIFLKFEDIYSFSKGRNINGEEYISILNPIKYSKSTKIVFDKIIPYAPKQIIDAITN